MLWASWTSLVPPALLVSLGLSAWWFTEPKNPRVNFTAAAGVVLFCWAVAPDRFRRIFTTLSAFDFRTLANARLDLVLANNANMLLTGAAVVWLLVRAWQVLRKPVPELISILGVEVPDPPDVSLAGIRSDAATVNWTRPPPNRSVLKFLIQVNGVVVGEVGVTQEPAIVVTGLKPSHFYNVRVIAVGSNNFQAGSRVIRLRTFSADGRPQLGNGRLPSGFLTEEQQRNALGEAFEETAGSAKNLVPALETATAQDPVGLSSRDGGQPAPATGSRRNTVTRRHSPSMTSQDQPPGREEPSMHADKTLKQLTETFEKVRLEANDVALQIAKEEYETKRLLEELEAEKSDLREKQKKKDEQTEKLRKAVNLTERNMRNAMQRKAHKEKLLREKQNERTKLLDNIVKWEQGIEEMGRDQDRFKLQLQEQEDEREKEVDGLCQANQDLQAECARLETELKEKRDQVRELQDARRKLHSSEQDHAATDKDEEARKEPHQRRIRELQDILNTEIRLGRKLDDQYRGINHELQQLQFTANYAAYSQANSASTAEFDATAGSQLKRRTRASHSLSNVSMSSPSPLPPYSLVEPMPPAPAGFASSRSAHAPPGFGAGPYMALSSHSRPPHPSELLSSAQQHPAPLSPSAAALLPSNILDDNEEDGPGQNGAIQTGFYPPPPYINSPGRDQLPSPVSSVTSENVLPSPHGSGHNVPFPLLRGGSIPENASLDARDATTISSSHVPEQASTHKRNGFFSSFQRTRNPKPGDEVSPALGALKPGQTQSLPRESDEMEGPGSRRRRLSSNWTRLNRNSVGPIIFDGQSQPPPQEQALISKTFLGRSRNPFSGTGRAAPGAFPERNPASPRPASIASSDFPRPSTDSCSIWGPPDAAALATANRLWPSETAWSRNPSRRPSLHGSPSALETTLASADDEILNEDHLPNVNQVGVIGSRPPQLSSKLNGRLNPNAPAFIGSLFRSNKSDSSRERDRSRGKDNNRAREKDRAKDKSNRASKELLQGSSSLLNTPHATHQSFEFGSPGGDSHRSRDALSIHTQTSALESHDSLSLDHSISDTPSDVAGSNGGGLLPLPGMTRQENSTGSPSGTGTPGVVRKLFRKSSSGKFSLPMARLGGSRKGPGSVASMATTNSERGGSSHGGGGNPCSFERSSFGDLSTTGAAQSEDGLTPTTAGGGGGDELASPAATCSSAATATAIAIAPGSSPSLAGSGSARSKDKHRWLSNFSKKGRKGTTAATGGLTGGVGGERESLDVLDKDYMSSAALSESDVGTG